MIPQFSWPRPRFKAFRSTTNVLHCWASLASATDNDYSSDDCPTYSLACRLRLALDIPDLSSTRALETWLDMKWTIYPYFLSLVFDDEPPTRPSVARKIAFPFTDLWLTTPSLRVERFRRLNLDLSRNATFFLSCKCLSLGEVQIHSIRRERTERIYAQWRLRCRWDR